MRKVVSGLVLASLLFGQTISIGQANELYDEAVNRYDLEIDNYRSDYTEYLLKKEQFEKIDSFANQEELVTAAKKMLITRAEVWLAYWQAMQTLVRQTQGVDREAKERLINNMIRQENELQDHQERLSLLNTREELVEEAAWLNVLKNTYQNLAYETLIHVRLAQVHWALIQLETFVPILEENVEVQIRDENIRKAKLRGLGEVRLLLESSRTDLEPVVNDFVGQERRNYEQSYEDMVKELAKLYGVIERSNSLVAELSEGTEL